jgi:hypothetical protein
MGQSRNVGASFLLWERQFDFVDVARWSIGGHRHGEFQFRGEAADAGADSVPAQWGRNQVEPRGVLRCMLCTSTVQFIEVGAHSNWRFRTLERVVSTCTANRPAAPLTRH